VKSMPPHELILPPKGEENYLYTLQKALDEFIKKQTRQEIWGIIPIKLALIIQKAITECGLKLNTNVQLVGGPSVGKTLVLKYYGFLLNSSLHLMTNGMSVSIPGLRGSKLGVSIPVFNKDQSIISIGHLGRYKTINIDEAGQNKELVENLKAFLAEDDYGYEKAGGVGVFHKRSAHINLSENINTSHLSIYMGTIRKQYKEMTVKIGKDEKIDWDETWDLHLPISEYSNTYLRKIIKDVRENFKKKQLFWIDGHDYALHDRFPFYFYLESEKQNEDRTRASSESVMRKPISENLELMEALRTDSINKFFEDIVKYKYSEQDNEMTRNTNYILRQYNIDADERMKEFYYNVVCISRIINQRFHYMEMDYDILKYIIEKTNKKLDVSDTNDIKIIGPPDTEKQKKIDETIEESTKGMDSMFGLPEGEFK